MVYEATPRCGGTSWTWRRRRPADRRPMCYYLVRQRCESSRRAPMANLAAGPVAAALAQSPRLASPPVARRRFAAVMAVRGQPHLQFPFPLQRHLHPLAEVTILG